MGDPLPNKPKRLRVDYTFDNVERYKTAEDEDTLTISALTGN